MKLLLLRALAVTLMWSMLFSGMLAVHSHSWPALLFSAGCGMALVLMSRKVDLK